MAEKPVIKERVRGTDMANTAMKDMTTGSPTKLLLGFFFPMLFGMLFQQFYNSIF